MLKALKSQTNKRQSQQQRQGRGRAAAAPSSTSLSLCRNSYPLQPAYLITVPKMRSCFVPLCDSQCKSTAKRMLFTPSKEMFEAWKSALPKKREFKATDKVCARHFSPEHIITTFDHVIDGKLFQMERARPKLKTSAVPHLNFPPPELYDNFASRKRKAASNLKNISPKSKLRKSENSEEVTVTVEISTDETETEQEQESTSNNEQLTENAKEMKGQEDGDSKQVEEESNISRDNAVKNELVIATIPDDDEDVEETIREKVESFETFYDDIFEVMLPSTLWATHRCPDRNFVAFSYMHPEKFLTTKSIVINNRGTTKIYASGRVIGTKQLVAELSDAEVIADIVTELDEMRICRNIDNLAIAECEVTCDENFDVCSSCRSRMS